MLKFWNLSVRNTLFKKQQVHLLDFRSEEHLLPFSKILMHAF